MREVILYTVFFLSLLILSLLVLLLRLLSSRFIILSRFSILFYSILFVRGVITNVFLVLWRDICVHLTVKWLTCFNKHSTVLSTLLLHLFYLALLVRMLPALRLQLNNTQSEIYK